MRGTSGLQVAFLGFVAPKELSTANSKFRLLGLKWRGAAEKWSVAELIAAAQPEGPKDPFHENLARARAQAEQAGRPAPDAPAAAVPLPGGVLVFDSEKKAENVPAGEPQARFVFRFTNVSAKEVTISKVTTSCGCTTAELPPMPWKVAPGARGRIPVTMNVAGHTGKSSKTVTVNTLDGFVALQVEATILPATEGAGRPDRQRNMELAKADRQAVFKGDCAKCHAEAARA
jgi:hypothetical protein